LVWGGGDRKQQHKGFQKLTRNPKEPLNLERNDKAEALRQAQLAERRIVLQRYGKDDPSYWGAFVLTGH